MMIWILAIGLMVLAIISRRSFYEGRNEVPTKYFNNENYEMNLEKEYLIKRSLVRPSRSEYGGQSVYDQEADAKAQEEIEMLKAIWRLPYN